MLHDAFRQIWRRFRSWLGRRLRSCLVSKYRFRLFRLELYQYHRSCKHLIMEVSMVCPMVFLVERCCSKLRWGLVLCTKVSWRIIPTYCHRAIRKLGWMGHWLGCNRLSLRNRKVQLWFHYILIQPSWQSFRPSCCSKQSFVWLPKWRTIRHVLWFIRLWRYQLRILPME